MVNGQVCEAMIGQVGKWVCGCLPMLWTSKELCVWAGRGGDGEDVCGRSMFWMGGARRWVSVRSTGGWFGWVI